MTRITSSAEAGSAATRNWRPPAPYFTQSSNGVVATPTAPNGKVAGYLAFGDEGNDPQYWPPAIFQRVWPSEFPSIFGPYPPEGSQFPASDDGLVFPEAVVYTPGGTAEISRVLEGVINALPDIYRGPAYPSTGVSPGNRAIGYNFNQRTNAKIVWVSCDFLGSLTNPTQFVRNIDLLLTGGKTPQSKIGELLTTINALPTATAENREARVGLAAATIANGPEFYLL
jgi:hypothetical protein